MSFLLICRLPGHPTQTHTQRYRKSKHGVGFERTLRTEELAGDVEGLTSHDDDLLAIEQLLGNSAGQATKEVSLAVNDDLSNPSALAHISSHILVCI